MRPWSLLTILNFSERRPTDTTVSLPLLVAETIIDKFSNDISFYQKDKYLIVHSSDINACEYVPVILKEKGLNDYDTIKSFREMIWSKIKITAEEKQSLEWSYSP